MAQPIDLINEPVKSSYGYSPWGPQVIIKDKHGFMWVGTETGLLRYDGYSFKIYDSEPGNPNSLSHNEIKAMLESKYEAGSILWIGTASGLNKFDTETEKFHRFFNNPVDTTTISDNFITALCEDNSGNIWVGTFDGGLSEALAVRGHSLQPLDSTYGNMQAIYWDRNSGQVFAASDPRGSGESRVGLFE